MIKLVNSLNNEIELPFTIAFKKVPLDIIVPAQALTGRNGAVKTGRKRLQERRFTLEGGIYSNAVEELDSILQFLMQSPIKVYRQHYHDRYLVAEPLGAQQEWANLDAEIGLQIPMVAFDPLWQGDVVTETINGTQTISVTGTTATLPYIETTTDVTGLSVNNVTTGHKVELINVNGKIKIDNVNLSVVVNDNNKLNSVNDSWLVQGFELSPGDNVITTSKTIELTYRPRWY